MSELSENDLPEKDKRTMVIVGRKWFHDVTWLDYTEGIALYDHSLGMI
jgi:hypothetical protein